MRVSRSYRLRSAVAGIALTLGALASVPASANGYQPTRSYHHHYRSAPIYHRHQRVVERPMLRRVERVLHDDRVYHRPRYSSRYHDGPRHVSYERPRYHAPYWHRTVWRAAHYLQPSYGSYDDDSYEAARPLYRTSYLDGYYHRPYAPSYYTYPVAAQGCCSTYPSGCCGSYGYGGYGYGNGYGGYYPRVAVVAVQPVVVSGWAGGGYGGYGWGGGCRVAQYGWSWPRTSC